MSSSPPARSHRRRPPRPRRLPLSSRPSHELDAEQALTTRQALSRRAQRARPARSCHLTSSLETRKGLEASRRAPPLLLSSLDLHFLHTRLHFLTSFFLLSNPSLCPSTCLLSLPGRATASRPTPAVNKIKYTWRTPPEGERGGHWISPTASCDGRSAATWRALGPKRSASDRPDQQWWRRVPV